MAARCSACGRASVRSAVDWSLSVCCRAPMRDEIPGDLHDQVYKGWRVYDNGPGYHPATGRWRAVRHGVGMGHPTLEGITGMIDARAAEEEERRGGA